MICLVLNGRTTRPKLGLGGQEGSVGYSRYIAADGTPQACEVTQSSGFELLDDATCKLLMERSDFAPATDAEGNPVASEFPGQYRWSKREPEFASTMTVDVAFTVDKDGRISDCEQIEISGSISERMQRQVDREPCPGANGSEEAPFRDKNGVPVRKRVNLLLQLEVEDIEQ